MSGAERACSQAGNVLAARREVDRLVRAGAAPSLPRLRRVRDVDELAKKLVEVLKRPLRRSVDGRCVGIVVDLHEQAIHAARDARTSDGGDEIAKAAAGDAAGAHSLTRRLLQAVRNVRARGRVRVAHRDDVAHVHNQVRVAVHGAALADEHIRVTSVADLLRRVAHHGACAELACVFLCGGCGGCGVSTCDQPHESQRADDSAVLHVPFLMLIIFPVFPAATSRSV